jgi:RNA polymerase sigma-70 factor (ECF subfamily)
VSYEYMLKEMAFPDNQADRVRVATWTAFQETRWSMVLRATAGSKEALEDLSRSYWPAVYAFVRRSGFSPQDAEDITQETFSRLLKEGQLPEVDQARGRFRSFLCACAEHEASHCRDRCAAQKRGANRVGSLDTMEAEQQYELLPVTDAPIEQVFDRAWSTILVSRALNELKSDYARLGKTEICNALLPLLSAGTERGDHRVLANKLGLSEGNARVIWSRFKTAFIGHLRSQVAETVAEPGEVDAELRYLLRAWLTMIVEPSEKVSRDAL